jgi:hypothetical protein
VRRHYPWRSWGRRWLPLTAEAWEAKKQALMASPVIEDPRASIQLPSPAVVTLPESSNKGKGSGRACAGDVELDDNPHAYPARKSQTKRPRDEALQVGERSSDVQTVCLPWVRILQRLTLDSIYSLLHSWTVLPIGLDSHHQKRNQPIRSHACLHPDAALSALSTS